MHRLPLEARLEHVLIHPDVVPIVLRVRVLAVLPVRSPTAVGPVRDVHETLELPLMIAIVVDANQIAVLVERELLEVADARGENLEVRTVGIRT